MKRITDFEMINATVYKFPFLRSMPFEFISELRNIIHANLESILEQQPIV